VGDGVFGLGRGEGERVGVGGSLKEFELSLRVNEDCEVGNSWWMMREEGSRVGRGG
jgi:hypothetical protein